MKAIVKQTELGNWEIKNGNRRFAMICFPNEFHPNTFTIEFYKPNLAITGVADIHAAVEKVKMYCEEFFGITEIADKQKYPIELMACFADPLFA